MGDALDNPPPRPRRQQLIDNLARLVANGRVTEEEYEQLLGADESRDFESVLESIRRRHAKAAIEEAVEKGSMTREEGAAILERLDSGEDAHSLRALRRKLRQGGRDKAARTGRESPSGDDQHAPD
jgi:hypothetical protein